MKSIRDQYEKHGVIDYYQQFGDQYHNPHAYMVGRALEASLGRFEPDLSNCLDLAAGAGEISLLIKNLGKVHGIDPYTSAAYKRATGLACERFSFADIAGGALRGRSYSLIICSYAMHLLDVSRLPLLCLELSEISKNLLIITPHKNPVIEEKWGWRLVGEGVENARSIVKHRSRYRYYERAYGITS